MLLGHSVEDGLHHRRGDRDACLANTVALLSQNGNDRIDSVWRFAAFLLGSRPAIVAVSASRAKVGRTSGSHAARWSATILLSHPCKWRSSCVVHHPRATDLVMAGGMPASTSQAPLLRQPSTSSRRGPLSAKSGMPWRHQGWPLRLRQSLWGVPRAWPPNRTRPFLYCSSKLGFPTRLFFRAGWPPLHLELGRCISLSLDESEEVFLGMPLLPSCHRRTRWTSEEPF